jgi:hypothetical protein
MARGRLKSCFGACNFLNVWSARLTWLHSSVKGKILLPHFWENLLTMLLCLNNHVLLHLMGFLPDGESIARCALTSKRIYELTMANVGVDVEQDAVWEILDRKLDTMTSKPKGPNARDRVCRFAAASLFAKKMEALAPAHHYSLKENSCPGCCEFPDAPEERDDICDLCEEERAERLVFFVRLSVAGNFIWEGFLSSQYGGNGSVYLTLPGDADLRPALKQWTN